jgi:hypothetical protein
MTAYVIAAVMGVAGGFIAALAGVGCIGTGTAALGDAVMQHLRRSAHQVLLQLQPARREKARGGGCAQRRRRRVAPPPRAVAAVALPCGGERVARAAELARRKAAGLIRRSHC